MSVTLIVAMVSQVFAYVQTHQTMHIKDLQFFVYQLYFNKPVKNITYMQNSAQILIVQLDTFSLSKQTI